MDSFAVCKRKEAHLNLLENSYTALDNALPRLSATEMRRQQRPSSYQKDAERLGRSDRSLAVFFGCGGRKKSLMLSANFIGASRLSRLDPGIEMQERRKLPGHLDKSQSTIQDVPLHCDHAKVYMI